MDLQHDLEIKSVEMAKEAAKTGKKVFAFVVNAEAEILKGGLNIVTFIPKSVITGVATNLTKSKEYKGKQTIKQLVGSGAKLEDIPLNSEHKKEFETVARKYGIDYSLKKLDNLEKQQFIIFYEAKDANVLNAAFKDFTARVLDKERRKSIHERLRQERTAEKTQNRERKRERKRERENVL